MSARRAERRRPAACGRTGASGRPRRRRDRARAGGAETRPQRMVRDGEHAQRRTGAVHTLERRDAQERFLDAQAALPASTQARRDGTRRDYAALAGSRDTGAESTNDWTPGASAPRAWRSTASSRCAKSWARLRRRSPAATRSGWAAANDARRTGSSTACSNAGCRIADTACPHRVARVRQSSAGARRGAPNTRRYRAGPRRSPARA